MSTDPTNRPPTTWELYRRTIVLTQLFVMGTCAAMMYAGVPAMTVLVMFFSLQAFGYLGAVIGARMSRRLTEKDQDLPLKRRRRD